MSAYGYPACFHSSICIHVVPCITYKYPACFHSSICIHVVPCITYKYPACFHSSAGIQVIPCITYKYPASFHNSICIKVVPFSGNCFPANYFLSIFIIFPTGFCLNPAFIFNFYWFKISCNGSICFYCMNIRIFFTYFFSVNGPVYKNITFFCLSSQCCVCTFFIYSCFTVKFHCTHCFIIHTCFNSEFF